MRLFGLSRDLLLILKFFLTVLLDLLTASLVQYNLTSRVFDCLIRLFEIVCIVDM